ncbi:MarR family transcriptional regulator [Bradyrhizobium sp. AZCC 2230]|uniref:MarR family transcriptional regulator n=1 Tax=Bradyrhizobium sp. AZCC 2230 TaxID=3117021 RepID=UPI002FF0A858
MDQLRLASAIGFDRTTISGVVDRLEAKGLMVRKISGTDRRAKPCFQLPRVDNC